MAVYQLDDKIPQVHETAWIADSADVMGEVRLDRDASAWFGSVLRGDNELVQIGAGSNVQDLSVLHTRAGLPLVLGQRVTVGHKVMLHSCVIGDESLIGMGAIVLNGVRIGKHCLVGAGAVVTEGKTFADGSLILGAPARVVRQVTPDQIVMIQQAADRYVNNARRYRVDLQRVDTAK